VVETAVATMFEMEMDTLVVSAVVHYLIENWIDARLLKGQGSRDCYLQLRSGSEMDAAPFGGWRVVDRRLGSVPA
jgi:hypothetical protein